MASTPAIAAFNPNYILSDRDLVDQDALSALRIQQFLEGQGSGLSTLTTDAPGAQKKASDIIYDAGQFWKISPKYLLVRLQVEQSLVSTGTPTQRQLDWATGYAVCDSCSKDDPAIQQYKGFFNQVNWAARRLRERYLPDLEATGQTFTGWGPGITRVTTEGDTVTPLNNATAAMYTYTPHVHGNFLIWTLWNRWFVPQYPDGSLLQDETTGGIWKIENGKRRPFKNRAAFFSRFQSTQIIQVSKNVLDVYEIGAPIQFPNYALVRVPGEHTYLIDGDTKRRILSPEVFRILGFNPEEIITGTAEELALYPNGEFISIESSFPTGTLLQSRQNGGISFIQNGIRHSIWSKEILQSRFRNKSIVMADTDAILQYTNGDPVFFNDGEIVTSPESRSVYFIANGIKRPIASKEAFDSLGFKWKNIIRTSQRALDIHPTGEPIDISSDISS
ncbi:MAG: hypothetical protein WC289_02960 [Patescibacteria group bacterium]|jgi:hypothetical protein